MTRLPSRTIGLFSMLDPSERVNVKLQFGSKPRETQQTFGPKQALSGTLILRQVTMSFSFGRLLIAASVSAG